MVFVTDDNPRHEDAADIRAAIWPRARCDRDWRSGAAIEAVLTAAQADDLVLLAGKGHESGRLSAT